MSSAELNDRYEALRRRLTGHTSGGGDGLAVLHRQGLHAWMGYAGSTPRPRQSGPPPTSAPGPSVTSIDRSPLLCLWTDMLLATLMPQEVG